MGNIASWMLTRKMRMLIGGSLCEKRESQSCCVGETIDEEHEDAMERGRRSHSSTK